MYMLKDVKSKDVKLIIDESSKTRVSLEVNGEPVSYHVKGKSLYRNDVKICDDLEKVVISGYKGVDRSTITLDLKI